MSELEAKLAKRPDIHALHGHFPVSLFAGRYPAAKTVVWLRNPVDRIISYYGFWTRLAPHGNPEHDRFLLDKPSLPEFARARRSEVLDYLDGKDITDFDFVGVVEHFEEDVRRFEGWLHSNLKGAAPGLVFQFWDSIIGQKRRVPQTNTSQKRLDVSDEMRSRIASVVEDEIKVYLKALDCRRG